MLIKDNKRERKMPQSYICQTDRGEFTSEFDTFEGNYVQDGD